MEKIFIVGAGGFASEVFQWAEDAGLKVEGFYSDSPRSKELFGLPVYKSPKSFRGLKYLIGIGDNEARKKCYLELSYLKFSPSNALIHPRTTISPRSKVGLGSIVCPGSVLSPNSSIGDFTIINLLSSVGHDTNIGAFVNIAPGVNISGNVTIGSMAYLGTNAAVREKVEIGQGATVGMGAVVVKDITPGVTVIGNPAKERV